MQPLKRQIAQRIVHVSEDTFEIPRSLDAQVDAILGPARIERGSMVGSLEVLDMHNNRILFRILLSRMPVAVDARLERREFLAGEFSGADIMTGHAATVASGLGADMSDQPHLAAYIERIDARPAFKRAWAA